MTRISKPKNFRYPYGTRLRKKSGSSWYGRVIGYYSTSLTEEGYAIESEAHPGSVQIYPVSALEEVVTNYDQQPSRYSRSTAQPIAVDEVVLTDEEMLRLEQGSFLRSLISDHGDLLTERLKKALAEEIQGGPTCP